ncbi:hypothetical protein CS063_08920 [Sporanaerobium hydrogeniformans]|uniref:Uncharacterized protein n=1 Tax=Sporanaerobium hydrogeniformans TaxID=3072179 RepID=A0AC61DCY5_9FIRM|nr:YlzJ-like family protein [Sporanaerobium hydrogeniformans]PHV70645.1 hypothetical protein CS063_08920 [Sporanaerobium hydrogeniformans]
MPYYSIAPLYGLDEPVEYVEIDYEGYRLLACKTQDGYVVERLYSTNPKDYLKQNLYPGQLLQNNLIKQFIK